MQDNTVPLDFIINLGYYLIKINYETNKNIRLSTVILFDKFRC